MNADGTKQTNLTENPDVDHYPAWSPDSKKIGWIIHLDAAPIPGGAHSYALAIGEVCANSREQRAFLTRAKIASFGTRLRRTSKEQLMTWNEQPYATES